MLFVAFAADQDDNDYNNLDWKFVNRYNHAMLFISY